jgi:D-alanine-D-alanine ligase
MHIGLTYDLKTDLPAGPAPVADDLQEEFDSPETVEALAAVLRGLGHRVEKLGDGPELLRRLLDDPPDFVFNIAEGQGVGRSREARVPAVLEMLGIPYTGSDPLTLAVTLEKDCAKRLVQSHGILVPWGVTLDVDLALADVLGTGVRFPLLVKPAWEGSSKGIRNRCLVDDARQLAEVVASLRRDHRQPLLIEEYVAGEELTVGVLGNAPPSILGVMRVVPRRRNERFVYSLEVKRDFRNQVEYECPARLPAEVLRRVEAAALAAYRALGCRDVSRVDFRLREGRPYFLEVNPLPGLNPESSDLVIMANLIGWDHARLVEAVLQAALKRTTAPR